MISKKESQGILALSAKELSLGYVGHKGVSEKKIARDLSFYLKKGEFACLLGPNGVGKSTLIRTLAGMQRPLAGRIYLEDTDIQSLSLKERARSISVVLTDSLPLGIFTAYSLVALGRHPHTHWSGVLSETDEERIAWALESVGAAEIAERQVTELSDGERQKVSIARALAQEAPVILLDEPTAFLDLPRRVDLMRLLRELARREGLAVLLSTHDLDLALRSADRLWLLGKDGNLTQGVPEELALEGKIASVFECDELDWDAELGSFRMHRLPYISIGLSGPNPEFIWTRRALMRLGFEVLDAYESFPSVVIEKVDGRCVWNLNTEVGSACFSSLAELIEGLETGVKD